MAAPSGWLELDGSTVSTSTYVNLFGVMSKSQNGTRTSGSAIITSLGSTTTLKAGYYVFGTGITTGTTILSVDSSSQITMSANAGSSGTSTVIVSPWLLNTGTIKLPDLVTAGRYRRSRTSGQAVGTLQNDTFASHTHTVSGTTATESNTHTHDVNINTNSQNLNHQHSYTIAGTQTASALTSGAGGTSAAFWSGATSTLTSVEGANHQHNVNGTSTTQSSNHTHAWAGTSASTGSSETRPTTVVFITCVKT